MLCMGMYKIFSVFSFRWERSLTKISLFTLSAWDLSYSRYVDNRGCTALCYVSVTFASIMATWVTASRDFTQQI